MNKPAKLQKFNVCKCGTMFVREWDWRKNMGVRDCECINCYMKRVSEPKIVKQPRKCKCKGRCA